MTYRFTKETMMICALNTKLIQRAKERMLYPVGSTTPERHYDAVRDRKNNR
jgi:hypothetical protein